MIFRVAEICKENCICPHIIRPIAQEQCDELYARAASSFSILMRKMGVDKS